MPILSRRNGGYIMIQIDNKFDVGQEVHLIGRKCYTSSNGKKRFRWVVKTKKDI